MKKRSLFFRYFVSSILITLCVVLVFGMVFYYFNVVSIHSEVNTSRFSALSQALNKTDYLIESMSNIAYHFSTAENDGAFGGILRNAPTNQDEAMVYSQLSSYEENISIGATVGLYARGEPFIYLSNGKHSYENFERQFSGGADFTMSRLYSNLNSTLRPISLFLKLNKDSKNIESPATAFIFPIPQLSSLPSASLLFLIDGVEYRAMIDNYAGEATKNVYLIDQTMQIVYQTEHTPLSEEEKLFLIRMKGTGVTETTLAAKPMVVMRALSDNSGYSLVMVMNEDTFYSRVASMRRLVLVCVLCFAGLSLVLALVTAFKNYGPIKKLLGNIGVESKRNLSFGSNELEVVLDQFEISNQKNMELRRLIDVQRPYVTLRCIQNILRGNTGDSAQLAYDMQCANLAFAFPYFQVFLVSPISSGEVGYQIENIIQVLESLPTIDAKSYAVEFIVEKRVAVLVNFKNELTEGLPTTAYVAARLIERLKDTADMDVSIGIGNRREMLRDVHTSFVEALVIANEKATAGMHSFEAISDAGNVDYNIREMELAMLYHALQQGDSEVAVSTLEKLATGISEIPSMLIMQYQIFDVANVLIKIAGQMAYTIIHGDLQLLSDPKDMDRFLETAKKLAVAICGHCQAEKEKQRKLLNTEIIGFVNRHFRSYELSLEGAAAHFNLSISHLSRLFKQITGRTFVQYVTQLRMDAIKDELAHTDNQIKDIVNSAGYIDVASFVRKFKTIEGITPGQYRQAHKDKGL